MKGSPYGTLLRGRTLVLMGLLTWLLTPAVVGQTVRGTVHDGTSHRPLPGANILLVQAETGSPMSGTATDRDGAFALRASAPGAYDLVVRFVGYRERRLALDLATDGNQTVTVTMTPTLVTFAPLLVTASRRVEKTLDAPAPVSILEADVFERDAAPTPAAALRTVTGVDVQQGGINRYMIAVRGFNASFSSQTYPLVDYRESITPGVGLALYTKMPVHAIDLARVEVVRGPGAALYGAGVAQGVVHFITKDPFAYPGTTVALGMGEQAVRQGAFRHAGVFRDRLGYKIVGSYMEGEDWKLDPDDPHDAAILNDIQPRLTDLDGNDADPLGRRHYDAYAWYINGQAHYRFGRDALLVGNAGYATSKAIVNGSLGEIQINGAGTAFGQLRFRKGSVFAQASLTANMADEDLWFYRVGKYMYDRSLYAEVQGQVERELLQERAQVVLGAEYKRTTPRTRGTISGRYEHDDTVVLLGSYAYSTTRLSDVLSLILSGRLDYIEATDERVFSPRLALVYKPAPAHTLRASLDRSFSRPFATNYFNDLQVGDAGVFAIRFMGTADVFTFTRPLQTSSLIGTGRDAGVGMDLGRAYVAATDAVATLVPDPSPDLLDLLRRKAEAIEGFADGHMTLRSPRGVLLAVVETLNDWPHVRLTETRTAEVGYKGLLGTHLALAVDAYYVRKIGFLRNQVVTPFVEVASEELHRDLATAVEAAFTDAELAPYGLDAATLADLYGQTGAGLLGDRPVGLIESDQNVDPTTRPEQIIANTNVGTADYFGIDVSVEVSLSDRLSGFFNGSWLSDNVFDDAELGVPGTGFVVSTNAPTERLNAGAAYRLAGGLRLHGSLRYKSSFEMRGALYSGTVDAYTLVDLGTDYTFPGRLSGLMLTVTAQNALNHRHREYIGFPEIGRLVTARATYHF